MIERYGRFLDPLADAQISERIPRLARCAMSDLLDRSDALGVQAQLRLYRTKLYERITDQLLLFW